MIEPISPEEVYIFIPDCVIEIVNHLIQKNWDGRESKIHQNEIIPRIGEKTGQSKGKIFEKHWLDIEPLYIAKGWKVKYENYIFTFTK